MPNTVDPSDVPAWPVVVVELRTDGQINVDGDTFAVPDGADVRQTAIAAVATTASLIGRPVRAEAREPDGTIWPLIVTPDGQAIAAGAGRRPPPTAKRRGFRGGLLRRPTAEQVSGAPRRATMSAGATVTPQPGPPQGPAVPLPPPAPRPAAAPAPGPSPSSSEAAPEAAPSTQAASASFPPPDAEVRAALDRVFMELHRKRLAAARSRAQALVDRLTEARGHSDPAVDAAREVLAYTTFVAGDAARAARLYADLATPRVGISVPPDSDGARLADNAHFCWSRSRQSPDIQETGIRILALRKSGWGPDSGPARAAQRRLSAVGPGNE
jgi:hypothetical protein